MRDEGNLRTTVRILIADDHFIVREGLRLILESEPDFIVVGGAADRATTVRLAGELEPDVVLMDLLLSGLSGLEAVQQIRLHWPAIAIVILTTYDDDELMLKGLRAGASSYLLKNVDSATLFHAIRTAARGETLLASTALERLLVQAVLPSFVTNRSQKRGKQTVGVVLTPREQAVLEAVARGARNKEIAVHLGISEPTVKTHLVNLYAKLNVDSRAFAVAVAIEQGLISLVKNSELSMN